MGKFRVTAVQKVVYETFIEAPDKETAWASANNDNPRGFRLGRHEWSACDDWDIVKTLDDDWVLVGITEEEKAS